MQCCYWADDVLGDEMSTSRDIDQNLFTCKIIVFITDRIKAKKSILTSLHDQLKSTIHLKPVFVAKDLRETKNAIQ